MGWQMGQAIHMHCEALSIGRPQQSQRFVHAETYHSYIELHVTVVLWTMYIGHTHTHTHAYNSLTRPRSRHGQENW